MGLASTLSAPLTVSVFIVGVIIFIVRAVLLRRRSQSYIRLPDTESSPLDEKVQFFGPQKLPPGDSGAYYTGDPNDDILKIISFKAERAENFHILQGTYTLTGKLTRSIGKAPRVLAKVYINGWKVGDWDLPFVANGPSERIQRGKFRMWQHGEELANGTVPSEGDLQIRCFNQLPLWVCDKGWWSAEVEIVPGDEVEGRITGFEGKTWIEGAIGDGSGTEKPRAPEAGIPDPGFVVTTYDCGEIGNSGDDK